MTKEEREEAKNERERQRNSSMSDARTRQARSDAEVYGDGSMLLSAQKSSSGGDSRGGIWDVSTDNYKQKDRNESDQNSKIGDDGIDAIGRGASPEGGGGGGGGDIEFNGSVLICINGSPYYIDIPYDSDTGAYAAASGANFPITEP